MGRWYRSGARVHRGTVPRPRAAPAGIVLSEGLLSPVARKRGLATGRANGRCYSFRAAPRVGTITRLTQVSRQRRIPGARMTFVPPGLNRLSLLPRVKFQDHNETTTLVNETC